MFSRLGRCVMAVQAGTVHYRTSRWSAGGSDCAWTVPSDVPCQLNLAPPLSERTYHAIRCRRFWEFAGVLGGVVAMDVPGLGVVHASHPFHAGSAICADRGIHDQPVPA